MKETSIEEELVNELSKLSPQQQKYLLDYARSLSGAKNAGIPGKELLRFQGVISLDDLDQISKAIEDDCETVNPDEW